MRSIYVLAGLAALILISAAASAQSPIPQFGIDDVQNRNIDFNGGWLFHKGDAPGAEAPGFEAGGWQAVELPHDWSIEGPFAAEYAAGTGFVPGGIGWYRKAFTLAPSENDKHITIEFDGIYRDSEVWINGQFLGKRPFGYISFSYDLTPHLRWDGRPNVIAVKADHTDFADSRWYTGSGIYRDVRLRVTEKLHFTYNGIYVSTPEIGDDKALVRVEVPVRNAGGEQRSAQLRVRIMDGETVKAEKAQTVVLEPGADMTRYVFLDLEAYERWDIDSPKLYTVETQLTAGDDLQDRKETPLGVRTFQFDPDKGFFLNGRNVTLMGVCVHHDAGALGAAVPKEVWRRRLLTLKTLGTNAIRMSHNPPDPGLLDLCDELGFVVMNEAFDEFSPPKRKWVQGWNQGEPSLHGYGEVFPEWSQRDMADFVRRDRNHPSIIMWSIGNEIDYPNDPYTFEMMGTSQGQDGWRRFDPDRPNARMMIEYGRPLAAIIRELDPTRPVTMALANRPVINAIGLPELLDVVGYNYQEVNYEEDHATYPERVYLGSETRHDFGAWVHVRDKEYISGQFLWTGIDYLGEANRFPSRAAGSGLLDLAGFVKPRGQFRKALWTDEPMIWAGQGSRSGGGFAGRSGLEGWFGEEGRARDVDVYTNCTEAELFLNGESLGRKTRDAKADPTLRWEVPFAPGELKAVAYRGGEAVAEYAVRSAGEPARVAARLVPMQPGDTTAQIEIEVVDANGVRCWRADTMLTVEIEGPGRLLGIENGDTSGSDPYQDAEHPAFNGRALAFVKAGGGGTVTVTVSGEGLNPAELRVR